MDSIQSILHEPKATGMTINDVEVFKHSFQAETPGGVARLFEVRAGEGEGTEVLALLRTELLRR